MDDREWQEFREEALRLTREKEERILKKWLDKIGHTKPLGYYFDKSKKVLELYTTHPGWLIGRQGVHIIELKRIIAEEYVGEWTVKFTEIRGGFVNVNKEN